MAKASYSYVIDRISGRKVILINDRNGRMTVTNDIENIVDEIVIKENLDIKEYLVVYKDSTGVWDGYDPFTDSFVVVRGNSAIEAVNLYIDQLESN